MSSIIVKVQVGVGEGSGWKVKVQVGNFDVILKRLGEYTGFSVRNFAVLLGIMLSH